MNPGEVSVGAGDVVELRLLADPENAVGHDAHQKNQNSRREHDQVLPEIALGVDSFGGRDPEIEHEQRHGYGEDAVAERGEALHAFSCNLVVQRVHRRESSGLQSSEQNFDRFYSEAAKKAPG